MDCKDPELLRNSYDLASVLQNQGKPANEIVRQLIERGLSQSDAQTIVTNLQQLNARTKGDGYSNASAGLNSMLIGAAVCIGGSLITWITYQQAANNPGGGRYVIWWGAIAYGAVLFFRGLAQSTSTH